MASLAQSLPAATRSPAWQWEWLREELAPYPGRALLVARMVTAATLVMIISMTFRLPYGAYAALFALNVSRESLEGTKRAVKSIVVGFCLAGAYLLTEPPLSSEIRWRAFSGRRNAFPDLLWHQRNREFCGLVAIRLYGGNHHYAMGSPYYRSG